MLFNNMKLPDPKRLLFGLFPITQWSRTYDVGTAVGDLIAGITVALTLVPQAIAYASLAGLEPQYGLYASFAGSFVYGVMGTCPQINIGPSALISLLTFTYTNETNADFAVLLCFVGGIVQLIAGIAQLGFLVEFVSVPVVSGFTSAAAITIASSQIKGLLGLRFSSETFITTWQNVFHHISETRLPDTLLSLVCCIILIGMKALKDIHIKDPEDEKGRKTVQVLRKSLWFTGVARNAFVVALATVAAFIVHVDENDPLILTGNITPGLPTPQVPAFETTIGNNTFTAGDMLSHLGTGLVVLPLVAIISNVAIAKAFARGKTLDATQEIIALGACNFVGAFFRSMPVNGSFSRSAVSDASGVRTPAAGFYTGIIVLLTLALLTPYFYFIPRAALSSVIVCAVLHMVDLAIIKSLWKTSKFDLIPLLGTFICCLLLGVELGLICGVGIDAAILLFYHSRPPLDLQLIDDGHLPPHYAIHPVGGLHFAGAEKVRSKLVKIKNSKTGSIVPELLTVERSNENGIYTERDRNMQMNVNRSFRERDSNIRMNINSNGGENGSTDVRNGTVLNGNVTNGIVRSNIKPNLLVVYCDGLYRMDYTFLQSLKMLVSEWCKNGRVVWCNARPYIKEQLHTIIQDPVFCDTPQLGIYLNSISAVEESHAPSDTPL